MAEDDLVIQLRIGADGATLTRIDHAAARGDQRAHRAADEISLGLLRRMRDTLIAEDRAREGEPEG